MPPPRDWMPGGSGSPTGRMPQDRSLIPHHRSGVTSSVSPSTVIDPAHRPVCAIRLESNTTRSCERMKCCGSTCGGIVPSQVRSNDSPCSFGLSTTRSRLRPSSTSTPNGPTRVFIRSAPSSREARTTRCADPRRSSANASVTPRFGYWPRPTISIVSPVSGNALK